MLPVFHRKELTVTFSVQRQEEIRKILSAHGISYSLKVVNRNSPGVLSDARSRTGTFGQKQKYSDEYIFYVRKKDFQKASEALGTVIIP